MPSPSSTLTSQASDLVIRPMPHATIRLSATLLLVAFASAAEDPAPVKPAPSAKPTAAAPIVVTAQGGGTDVVVSPAIDRFAPPQTRASLGKAEIDATVNIIDTQDAIKYLPSIFVRKRNYGDTQPVIATRTWGVNSSARSLVYVDDVPITALIGNNNSNGAPRWGIVAPEQIEGVDFLYGPFAAQYSGNSIGGVLLITTRTPEKLSASFKQTGAWQTFDHYNTKNTYFTSNTAATVGDRVGKFTWFLSANHADSRSQPLTYIATASTPAGTTGTIPEQNKTGGVANVVGAGGLLHTVMNNVTAKVGYDLTPWLRAVYTVGFWSNNAHSSVQTYLSDAAGNPTYGGVAGFASSTYELREKHLMQAISLKTDTKGRWDGEVIATRYEYLEGMQRTPGGVLTGTDLRTNGTIAHSEGTGWDTLDLKGIWRPTGIDGRHEVSFGVHSDRYELKNTTYLTPDWRNSGDNGSGVASTVGEGETETQALWLQEVWKIGAGFQATIGGRFEHWKASDGYNFAGNVATFQPGRDDTSFSPKASLAWKVAEPYTTTLSFGQAYRYPTVGELYQLVQTGPTFSSPNPDLKPEQVRSWEWAHDVHLERTGSSLRVSLFQEDVKQALIQQTNLIAGNYVNVWQNVEHIRNRGIEVVAKQRDAFIAGLDFSNSLTYVNARIVANPSFVSATGTTSTGKRVPYIPDWRDTAQITYRPSKPWAFATAARYSGKMWSTLDNTDSIPHVYGAFDRFFVVDLHASYAPTENITFDAGIDNVFDTYYVLFHPFPGRTFVVSGKLAF